MISRDNVTYTSTPTITPIHGCNDMSVIITRMPVRPNASVRALVLLSLFSKRMRCDERISRVYPIF
jgi:hypothetical protein